MLLIRRNGLLAGVMFFASLGAIAQTVTTNGGATNTVPKFSSSTTVVNSAITENNGHVVIGTTNPQSILDITGSDGVTLGITIESNNGLFFGTASCCGNTGPKGSSLTSSGGWDQFYNGLFLNSNGTGFYLWSFRRSNQILLKIPHAAFFVQTNPFPDVFARGSPIT